MGLNQFEFNLIYHAAAIEKHLNKSQFRIRNNWKL